MPKRKRVVKTKNDMIKALEERTRLLAGRDQISFKELEKYFERSERTNEELRIRVKRLESAFITFGDAISAMKKEQQKLIKQKQALEAKNKELEIRIAGIDVGAIADATLEKVQKSVHDNVEIFQHATTGKAGEYEAMIQIKEKAKELNSEDKAALALMKKGGKRNLAKVQNNELGQLYLFIRDTETAKTTDASKALMMDEAFVEGLAETLKNHKLIKKQYPAFGKPVLSKK